MAILLHLNGSDHDAAAGVHLPEPQAKPLSSVAKFDAAICAENSVHFVSQPACRLTTTRPKIAEKAIVSRLW
jgi:hypothetical protein